MTMLKADFNPYEPPAAEIGKSAIAELSGPAWLTIFTRPRATIRRILDSGRTTMVLPLAMGLGIFTTFWEAAKRYLMKGTPLGQFLVETLVGGSILGIFLLYSIGFLLRLIGRWFGGRGSQKDLRTAMAWASLPLLPTLVNQFFALAFFGVIMSGPGGPPVVTRQQAFVRLGLSLPQFIALGWSCFLWVKCVAEAHRFGWLKAMVTGFLGYLVCLGVAGGVTIIIYLLGFPI